MSVTTETAGLEWIKGLETGQGSTYEDYVFLYGLVALLRPGRIVETGTNFGASSIVMATACKHMGHACRIDTVELSMEKANKAMLQIGEAGLADRISVFVGPSGEVLKKLQGDSKYDFAFVDGDHTYAGCKSDLALACAMADVVAVHDSASREVARCITEMKDRADLVDLRYPESRQFSEGKEIYRSAPGIAILRPR